MLYLPGLISTIEVLIIMVPALLVVAFVTVAERKTMASMQRRLGPNIVGYYGLLQAFADALKLILKEYVSPTQANMILFFLGPIITLIFSLLGYIVVPYGPGLTLFDFNLGILFMLAVSSLSTYGILLAGWSANSKYAFLGSLRSTAQLISYELILSSVILLVVLLTSSLNLTVNIEAQKAIWFVVPLFPIFIIFFIGAIAETNRAPFDLAEAESELVSGFMTEHSAVIFVFFFLAEYASIVLICILTSLLFLGGYNVPVSFISYIYILLAILIDVLFYILFILIDIYNYILRIIYTIYTNYNSGNVIESIKLLELYTNIESNSDTLLVNTVLQNTHFLGNYQEGFLCSMILGIKSFAMIFTFIWVRASFPRIRFDQLMSYCWTILLPLVFAFILFIPCIMYIFDMIPNNVLYF